MTSWFVKKSDRYRTAKYRKMMERAAKIKAIKPLLDIIEKLNHLRFLFLADMIDTDELIKRSLKYAGEIIKIYFKKGE